MSVRRARSSSVLLHTAVLLAPAALLAACAAPAPRRGGHPARAAAARTTGTTVPDLLGRDVVLVDKLAAEAGVVAILSYRPQARQAPGTVVAVHPAGGSAVVRGSTVQVSVAGRPGPSLDGTTFAQLESMRAGVSEALLESAGYAVRVDPVACAVRVEGSIPAEVAAALTARYGEAVVVVRDAPARRS
jgi:hypothetical protein